MFCAVKGKYKIPLWTFEVVQQWVFCPQSVAQTDLRGGDGERERETE